MANSIINTASVKKVKIDYIKPQAYCPMYVNGAIGSPTPKGDILINFYTDLTVLPDSQVHVVNDGKLGPEITDMRLPKIIKNGDTISVMRQIQSGIILSIAEAKIFHKWLGDQIAAVEEAILHAPDIK